MSSANNVVESFRDVVQDLLVPELKAVKVSVESLHTEIGFLRSERKGSLGAMRTEMRLRDEKMEQATRSFVKKLDDTIEIRERLASIEAHLPRQ